MKTQGKQLFQGKSYVADRDEDRLKRQLDQVYNFMKDSKWHTPEEITGAIDGTWASASSRIRDLRKSQHGGHVILRRYDGDGIWLYQMLTEAKE